MMCATTPRVFGMKRKSSPPHAADDRRRRKKKRGAAGRDAAAARSLLELRLLLAGKPAPHLLVTEVFYTPPPSHNHNRNHDDPSASSRFPVCSFNRRGAIVSVPLDGGAAPPPSAAIRRRGRLADLYRRCMTFVGATPDGRLAFAGSRGVFVVNPVTEALQGFETFGQCQKAIVATGGGHGGCNLFVSLGALLSPPALWRLDDDGEGWSQFPVAATAEQTGDVMSAVNCDGVFYLLHEDGRVSMVDAGTGKPPPAPLRMEKLPVASLLEHMSSPPCNKVGTLAGEGHLVESDGEVLFVRKLLAVRDAAAAQFCDHTEFVGVAGFEVYRLDVAGRRWAPVDALPGDTAVFVSPESAFAVRALEAAAGCMGGCVYFVGEKRCCFACRKYGGSTWGVYSMEDRKVLFEHDVASRGGRSEALWFLPNVT